MDLDVRLPFDKRREHFARARGNSGIPRNDFRHDSTHGLDAKRKGSDIEEQHIPLTAGKNVGLDGGAERDDFIRIQVRVRYAAKEFLDARTNDWNARRSPDH